MKYKQGDFVTVIEKNGAEEYHVSLVGHTFELIKVVKYLSENYVNLYMATHPVFESTYNYNSDGGYNYPIKFVRPATIKEISDAGFVMDPSSVYTIF